MPVELVPQQANTIMITTSASSTTICRQQQRWRLQQQKQHQHQCLHDDHQNSIRLAGSSQDTCFGKCSASSESMWSNQSWAFCKGFATLCPTEKLVKAHRRQRHLKRSQRRSPVSAHHGRPHRPPSTVDFGHHGRTRRASTTRGRDANYVITLHYTMLCYTICYTICYTMTRLAMLTQC